MSQLQIFPNPAGEPALPSLSSQSHGLIAEALAASGIGFERWPARVQLSANAEPPEILAAYAAEIARVQANGTYPIVDAIRMTPEHPERQVLRQKFLAEHTHSEDEVRFFVEGCGLFCLHIGEEVVQVLCEAGDLISVPAGTRHWFDMRSTPQFTAIRFFDNPNGWVAQFTGDPIAEEYSRLD